jgi:hypothetical protein
MSSFKIAHISGLQVSITSFSLASLLALWLILSLAGFFVLQLSVPESSFAGFLAMVLHVVSAIIHQFGHAWAARRAGYPMTGIRFWSVLATSIYPRDEPELAARVHIRRALGGPLWSFGAAVVGGIPVLVAALIKAYGLVMDLTLFFFLDNLIVFAIGALIPLGFDDGSTILNWWRKQ